MKKKITLITNNSSWWKAVKYRKESARVLLSQRKKGWKLKSIVLIEKKSFTISTNIYSSYTFYK